MSYIFNFDKKILCKHQDIVGKVADVLKEHAPILYDYITDEIRKPVIFNISAQKITANFDLDKKEITLPFSLVDPKSKSDALEICLKDLSEQMGFIDHLDFSECFKKSHQLRP